jgi:hypothetical protein
LYIIDNLGLPANNSADNWEVLIKVWLITCSMFLVDGFTTGVSVLADDVVLPDQGPDPDVTGTSME